MKFIIQTYKQMTFMLIKFSMERVKKKIYICFCSNSHIYHKWKAARVTIHWNSRVPSNKHTEFGMKEQAVKKYCKCNEARTSLPTWL